MKAIDDPSEVAAELCRELMARDETIAGIAIVIAATPDQGNGPRVVPIAIGGSILAPGNQAESFARIAADRLIDMMEDPESDVEVRARPRKV